MKYFIILYSNTTFYLKTTTYLIMRHLIGQTVIFQTKRKPIWSKALIPIFPEHTFSAKIIQLIGDFVLVKDIKLLVVERDNEYGRKFTLLARDKLYSDRSSYDTIAGTCFIKIKNNMYFDVCMSIQNTNLLQSIKNHDWFPKLYDICFYNLTSMELDFARELINTY